MAGRIQHPEDLIREWAQIPTLPQVIVRLGRLIDDPDVGLREIGAVVAEDPPLASQVLRTANSAYYGFAQRVVSLEHAATLLGGRNLRNIVLQASVMKMFAHVGGHPGLDLEQLWRHSILTGQLCWTVAFRCRAELGLAPEEFYVIGLLHDIGKFVMLDGLREEYTQLLADAERSERPIHVAEREAFGFHHADVGSVVAAHWRLPPLVCEAIRFHHGPRDAVASDPRVSIIANMNLMVSRVRAGDMLGAAAVIDDDVRRFLGLKTEDVADIVLYAAEIQDHVEV